MKIKAGDYIHTPRFLKVQIKKVYASEQALRKAGYTEPTHFQDNNYVILGKMLDLNHMEFAAGRKVQ